MGFRVLKDAFDVKICCKISNYIKTSVQNADSVSYNMHQQMKIKHKSERLSINTICINMIPLHSNFILDAYKCKFIMKFERFTFPSSQASMKCCCLLVPIFMMEVLKRESPTEDFTQAPGNA